MSFQLVVYILFFNFFWVQMMYEFLLFLFHILDICIRTSLTHSLTHPRWCMFYDDAKIKEIKWEICKWHHITIQMGDDDEWIHLSFSISFHRLCISWMEKDIPVSYSNYFHIYGVFPVSIFLCRLLFTHPCHQHRTGTARTAYLPFSPMSADCLANNAVSLLKERKNE